MAEESKHLTYFKVENFKCFDSFEMEDIGQFNLILGDNNVGKTSVLEALLFDENLTVYLTAIDNILYNKKLSSVSNNNFVQTNYLEYIFNKKFDNPKITTEYSLSGQGMKFNLSLEFLQNPTDEEINAFLIGRTNKKTDATNLVRLKTDTKDDYNTLDIYSHATTLPSNGPMIFSNLLYSDDLVVFFSEGIQPSKETKSKFLSQLATFIDNLEDMEISLPHPKSEPILSIRLKNFLKMMPLAMFGDGAIKLTRILLEITKTARYRLMIDEVDSGIHYSRFKDYWRTIIKAAASNNVQLFMTTHNVECLRYLKEVLEEEDMVQYQEKTRSYTLLKLPNGHIESYKYSFKQFEFAVDREVEIRGGQNG